MCARGSKCVQPVTLVNTAPPQSVAVTEREESRGVEQILLYGRPQKLFTTLRICQAICKSQMSESVELISSFPSFFGGSPSQTHLRA